MKSTNYMLLCFLILIIAGCKSSQGKLNRCISAEEHAALIKREPNVKVQQDKIENEINEYYKRFNFRENNDASARGGRIIIPVVVHVLYNNSSTDATNVADAKITEQLDRLNTDFRRLNTDITSVPGAFSGLTSDSRIEFQLCRRDPSCNPSTGITRTLVTADHFTAHDAKFASTGGVDAWNTSRYLNIWVIPALCLNGNCTDWLGASSFPSDPTNEYGFVVQFNFLGNTATPPYNLGRTAVHEFGHFFNLLHIWGDECNTAGTNCSACTSTDCLGTDDVGDTPNQGDMNFGTPSFPHTDCCSPASPGVMFMNYMDYTDDAAMLMFSQGQVDRMLATLYTTMSGLLSSDALIPPPTSASPDLYIEDTPEDIGNEPNNESDNFTVSEDIWVRNTSDGTANMEHQNPVYRPAGPSNFVYVRIRNRGCQTAPGANVKLYWAKASTGLGWPDPWNGGIFSGTALMGNLIDTRSTGSIAGGSSTVLEFAWNPPNPADYASFGGDQAHFCLLARIETPAVTETSDLWDNVKNNNNIAWKNVEVATATTGGRQATTLLANYNKAEKSFSIGFNIPEREESPFVNYDTIYAKLSSKLFENWRSKGSNGKDIQVVQGGLIKLMNPSATIDGITLNYKEFAPLTIYFNGDRKRKGTHVYFLDINQFNMDGASKKIVGAQRVWIKSVNK